MVVVAERVAAAPGKLIDVMASRPDVHSRRGAEHNGARVLGLQARERGDEAVCHPGADSVALLLVIKGDDAHVPENFGPDNGAGPAIIHGQGARGACPATFSCGGGLLARRAAGPAGQGYIGSGQRIFTRPENRVHQPERLDPLVAGEGGGDMAPEHLLQDAECLLGLGKVGAGGETVRRDLLRRRDDRLGAALVHAPQDDLEQMPRTTTALLRAGCIMVCLIAPLERGNHLAD